MRRLQCDANEDRTANTRVAQVFDLELPMSADEARQRDCVVVELLSQPHLADPEVVCAGGLGHHIIDHIYGLRVGKEHDSGRHIPTNRDTEARHSDLLGLIGSRAS